MRAQLKNGGLRYGHNPKNGGLRCDQNPTKGELLFINYLYY